MKKGNSSAKTGQKITVKEMVMLLPVLFILTVFMFCVRGSIVPTGYNGMFWYSGGEYTGDLYSYFRMQAFVFVTIFFSVYMIFCIFTKKVKVDKHKVYIPMAVYLVMTIVSYLFSEYKELALFGAVERYEGTLVLICYMLILFYTMHAVRNENGVKTIIRCFSIACLIMGIWGILQFMGMTLSDLPAWLYIPAAMREMVDLSQTMFTNAVNLFFTNQNYTSFFLIFPVCIFAMSCIAEEDRKKKVFYAVLTGLMLFCLWQASSLGGMVGVAVSVLVALLIAGAENIVKWRKSLGLLVLAAVISMGASLPVIMREVKSGAELGDTASTNADEAKNGLEFVEIDYIITDGPDILFGFAETEVCIATEQGEVKSVTDASGKALEEENYLLQTSAYIDAGTGYHVIEVKTANKTWSFVAEKEETFYITDTGEGIKLDKIESIGFENSQSFATYRGHIWSRTLPLLKDTLLFGHGADTFAVYYPQDDYAGRYNIKYYSDTYNGIIDKPHNMYLGTAVNTGVVSMISFVAIFVLYLMESIKIYRKHTFDGFMDFIGMAVCLAIAGFMVAGLVNDSTVQMMPMVYVFLGMGFAINRMVKNKKSE